MSSDEECDDGLGDEINGRTTGVFVMEHFFLCRHNPALSLKHLLQILHSWLLLATFGLLLLLFSCLRDNRCLS